MVAQVAIGEVTLYSGLRNTGLAHKPVKDSSHNLNDIAFYLIAHRLFTPVKKHKKREARVHNIIYWRGC